MPVPMYDHAATYRLLEAELSSAFTRVMARGKLDWGPEVPAFEREFAAWLGVREVIGTNSGTAALRIALRALGIGLGDEVITVPNSDISTTAAVHQVGAKAVWVDIDADTMNMAPGLVEAAITPRTKALLPVHMYGHPADMPELVRMADHYGLVVIEDACLALGATIEGRAAGQWGQVSCFSFAPSKHLGAYGSGGAVVTNDAELAEQMRRYAGYGQARERHYHEGPTSLPLEHHVEGFNERLDELHAALLRVKLPYLNSWLEARREHARHYHRAFANLPITCPLERPGCLHAYRNYVIRSDHRDALQRGVADAGIATGTPYAPPLHQQPVYQARGYAAGSFPVSEAASATLLSLPVAPELSASQRGLVIERVQQIVAALN